MVETATTVDSEGGWTFSFRHGPRDQQSTVTLGTGFSNANSGDDPTRTEKDSNETETNQAETISLLSNDADTTPTQRDGWLFAGPEWSLRSDVLLKLTFRPAWQGLPSYTKVSLGRDCLSRCCGTVRGKPIDFLSIVYTTDDIDRVERLDSFSIRGMQDNVYEGVRVYLKEPSLEPFHFENVPDSCMDDLEHQWNLPEHLTHEWDRLQEKQDTLPAPLATSRGPILTFAMPKRSSSRSGSVGQAPPLLWKVHLPANKYVSMETITVLDGKLETPQRQTPTHIYINGYQSWSFSGSVVKGAPQPRSAQPDFLNKAFNAGGSVPPQAATILPRGGKSTTTTSNNGGETVANASVLRSPSNTMPPQYLSDFFTCFTSDARNIADHHHHRHHHNPSSNSSKDDTEQQRFPMMQLDEVGGPALVLGFLSQHQQFGVITTDEDLSTVQAHASCENTLLKNPMTTDWAYAQLVASHHYDEEPMADYLVAVAAHNVARPLDNGPILTGWCSWYHYYSNIEASTLKENFGKLAALRKTVPTNVAVVDDGYMTAWGDWNSLKPRKFPDGLGGVSRDISDQGIRPGLWLAPFAADKHSKLAKRHPDWIISNDQGRAANSANCSKFFYGLDATNPHVREYAYSCIRRAVQDWKYGVLKIDFLYAAALRGNHKHDMSMTRAQAMHAALQTIRAAAGPDVFLIGCGCPLGSGIGYVDGMRVSADTGPTWYPAFPLPYWDNSTLPALRAMIRNSVSRAPLGHRWWHNDPDCLLIGTTTSLTDAEVASAASIVAMTCGMMLLSDDLTKVPQKRIDTVTKIFPMTGATSVVLDLHSTNEGLPVLLRLWCTDLYQPLASMEGVSASARPSINITRDHNHEATLLARHSSFSPDRPPPVASERKRNCIHVTSGLGTWTLLSVSNWTERRATLRVPRAALLPPPSDGWANPLRNDDTDSSNQPKTINEEREISPLGYHVFAFWSGTYQWLQDPRTIQPADPFPLRWTLGPHETELFHIKAVHPNEAAYIGSSLHFSCGFEVREWEATRESIRVDLRTEQKRNGHVYLYLPVPKVQEIEVKLGGVDASWEDFSTTPDATKQNGNNPGAIGHVIKVNVTIRSDGSDQDGSIKVRY